MAQTAKLEPEFRLRAKASAPRHLVQRVAVAAAAWDLEEVLSGVEALVEELLPVDHCRIATDLRGRPPRAWAVPIAVHGVHLGTLLVWSDHGAVGLSTDQRADLAGVAAIVGLAMLRTGPEAWDEHALRSLQRTAIAAERDRIAHDLHDSAAQVITGLGLRLAELAESAPEAAWRVQLDELHSLAARASTELRQAIEGLLCPSGTTTRLDVALVGLAREFERRSGIAASFACIGVPVAIGAAKEEVLLRVACEALRNSQRHGRASRVSLELSYGEGSVILSIRDNGIGFGGPTPTAAPGRLGLRTMQQRVADVGGELSVHAVGRTGVSVEAVIPGRGIEYAHDSSGGRR